ncbi:MAG TPA: hypothetical protein VK604_22175 [Bryobacteraceae bacterium]|nr:hypothetical protein [Bryobacteraceae bacterium]
MSFLENIRPPIYRKRGGVAPVIGPSAAQQAVGKPFDSAYETPASFTALPEGSMARPLRAAVDWERSTSAEAR